MQVVVAVDHHLHGPSERHHVSRLWAGDADVGKKGGQGLSERNGSGAAAGQRIHERICVPYRASCVASEPSRDTACSVVTSANLQKIAVGGGEGASTGREDAKIEPKELRREQRKRSTDDASHLRRRVASRLRISVRDSLSW